MTSAPETAPVGSSTTTRALPTPLFATRSTSSASGSKPLGQAHTHMTFSAPTPLQAGIAAALSVKDAVATTAACGALFGQNHRLLSAALLQGTSAKRICPAQGGFFLVAETDGRADVEWATQLAEERGVVGTPMSVFYSTPFEVAAPCTLVRFTVCKSREYIERACAALRQ